VASDTYDSLFGKGMLFHIFAQNVDHCRDTDWFQEYGASLQRHCHKFVEEERLLYDHTPRPAGLDHRGLWVTADPRCEGCRMRLCTGGCHDAERRL
jgi:hypothetical protein